MNELWTYIAYKRQDTDDGKGYAYNEKVALPRSNLESAVNFVIERETHRSSICIANGGAIIASTWREYRTRWSNWQPSGKF